MSISNIIDPSTRKIYPELIPPVPLAVPNLNQVLIAGNSAGTIGNPQTIENLDELETQKIYQGNYLQLELGESGDTVLLKGTTALGTIHVGNGVSIEKLPVGANGLVLKANSSSITGLGVEWAVDGTSGITGVSAGANITIDNTAPLTPVISLSNPLTSNVSLGTTSVDGTTGSLIFTNSNVPVQSISSIQAGGISSYDSTSASQIATMSKSGYTTQDTSANLMTIAPTSITKTGATAMSISSASSAITITPSATTDLNQVISGAGKVHTIQSSTGGATQPAYQIENTNGSANAVHIDLYKNSATPSTNDGIAGLSYHANNASATKIEYARIQADQRDTTAGSENGSVSVYTCCSSATPVEVFRFNGSGVGTNDLYKPLDVRNNNITSSSGTIELRQNAVAGGSITIANDGANGSVLIQKNGSVAGSLSISSNTTASITSQQALTLSGGGSFQNGIVINQASGFGTTLTTNLSNVKYYPETYLTNGNLNTVNVPLPQVINERLLLNNLGLTNTNQWSDFGNPVFAGYSAFIVDTNSNIWLANNSGSSPASIDIWDNSISTLITTISVSATVGSVAVNVFHEAGGYMFIGGVFDSINGNATQQIGITRVSISSYTEDPIWSSSQSIYGIQNGKAVFTISYDGINNLLYFGGNFPAFSNISPPVNYIAQITDAFNAGGTQTYTEFANGVNNTVYTILAIDNRVLVGGDFTNVDINSGLPLGYQYGAYFDYTAVAWLDFALNGLNGPVYIIKPTAYGYYFLAGAFSAPASQAYSLYVEQATPQNFTDSNLVLATAPSYKQAYGFGGNIAIMSGNDFYIDNAVFQTWSSLGDPTGSGAVSGISNFAGSWKVIYDSYGHVRSHAVLPHSCIFTGSFKYNNISYGNYTITTQNVSQQFIGDSVNSYWSIIGQGVGAFS